MTTTTTTVTEEKYKVVAPETMQETFMSDSEDEGGKDFFSFVKMFKGYEIKGVHILCHHLLGMGSFRNDDELERFFLPK